MPRVFPRLYKAATCFFEKKVLLSGTVYLHFMDLLLLQVDHLTGVRRQRALRLDSHGSALLYGTRSVHGNTLWQHNTPRSITVVHQFKPPTFSSATRSIWMAAFSSANSVRLGLPMKSKTAKPTPPITRATATKKNGLHKPCTTSSNRNAS